MLRPTAADLATRPIINPAPDTHPDEVPRSVTVFEPAMILPETEETTEWSPYYFAVARPYFGGWDELSQKGNGVMHVPQADMYDPSANPWPNNGQWDRPNPVGLQLLRLKPTTSAHAGFSMTTKRGDPTSLFRTPPIFGLQTKPVPAVGV